VYSGRTTGRGPAPGHRQFQALTISGRSSWPQRTLSAACADVSRLSEIGTWHAHEVPPGESCPCCGHRTLPERGYYELCPVCCWEDDPEQANEPWGFGGANGISLVEAQQAYLRYGAVAAKDVSKVRPARPDEARAPDWRPYDPADSRFHPLYTEEQERESETRGREHVAALRSGLERLRAEASELSDGEIEHRVHAFSDVLHLSYGDAEVELVSHLVRDDRWPRWHPLQAFAWAWRHRRSASLPARLSQLNFRPLAE
jgi:cysteine-rich CPCC protein